MSVMYRELYVCDICGSEEIKSGKPYPESWIPIIRDSNDISNNKDICGNCLGVIDVYRMDKQ